MSSNAILLLSKQFNFKLNKGNIDSDDVIDDEIIIEKSVSWEYREVKGLTFNKIVRIRNIDIKSGLTFIDCTFKEGIIFGNVTVSDTGKQLRLNKVDISFSNCKGSHVVFRDYCSFKKSIVFESHSTFEKIHMSNTNIVNGGIVLNNTQVNGLLDLDKVKSGLTIQQNSTIKSLRISGLIGDVSILSSIFEGNIQLWNLECPNSLTLNKNTFKETFNIKASRIKGLFIHGDIFQKKGELENRDDSGNNIKTYCNEIYVTEAKFNEGFYFEGMGNAIEKITLKLSPNFQGLAKFNNWRVDRFEIWGVCQNLKLLFKNMLFRFALLNDFTNYGEISFDKCKAITDSSLNLNDCDLGATKFNEFDFSSFDKLNVDNIILDKIKTSNIKWFEDKKLEISSKGKEKEINRRKRDFYRQIKYALSGSGNQIDSLLFKAREMKAYRDELKSTGKYKWTENWVIMGVSRTNNFGMSWSKPTAIIFLLTLAFYTLMLPLFSNQIDYITPSSFNDVLTTIKSWWTNFDVFWQLLNPTRKFSSVYGNIDSGLLQFLDLIHRIILGIFIFQIIKGFRRLNSK